MLIIDEYNRLKELGVTVKGAIDGALRRMEQGQLRSNYPALKICIAIGTMKIFDKDPHGSSPFAYARSWTVPPLSMAEVLDLFNEYSDTYACKISQPALKSIYDRTRGCVDVSSSRIVMRC